MVNTWGAPHSAQLKPSVSLYRRKQRHTHKPHITALTSHFKMLHVPPELDIALFLNCSHKQLFLRIAPNIEVIAVRVCWGSESMS